MVNVFRKVKPFKKRREDGSEADHDHTRLAQPRRRRGAVEPPHAVEAEGGVVRVLGAGPGRRPPPRAPPVWDRFAGIWGGFSE